MAGPSAPPAPAPKAAPSQIAIVDQDGSVSTVARGDLAAAMEEGAQVASPEQLRAAQVQARYGGASGYAGGLALETASQLSLGGTDVLGSALGGEAFREYRAGTVEASPTLPYAAGALSLAVPIAGEIGALGKVGKVARALSAPTRLATGIGRAAGELLPATAGTALGRVGLAGARAAVSGGVEAALQGAGQAISDAAIHNEPLTMDQVLAATGRTGAFGGVLGGVTALPFAAGGEAIGALGRAGTRLAEAAAARAEGAAARAEGAVARAAEAAPSFAKRVDDFASSLLPDSQKLTDLADEQAWRSTYSTKKFAAEADARFKPGPNGEPGGTRGIGRVLKETDVIRPTDGVLGNAILPEEIAERIETARERVGKRIDAIAESSTSQVKLGDVVKSVEAVIQPMREIAGRESTVKALERYRDALIDQFDGYSPRGKLLVGKEIPVQELRKQRLGLQEIAFGDVKSLDPAMGTKLKREMRNALDDLEVEALVRGGADPEEIAQLKRHYQGLRIAGDAVDDAVTRLGGANRSIGLTDYVAFAGAGGGLTGGIAAVANKIARERGSPALSVFLDDLARTRSIAESARKVGVEAQDRFARLGAAGTRSAAMLGHVAKAAEQTRKAVQDGVSGFLEGAKAKAATGATAARRVGRAAGTAARVAGETRFRAYTKAFTMADHYAQERKRIENENPQVIAQQRYGALPPTLAVQAALKMQAKHDYLMKTAPPTKINRGLLPFSEGPRSKRADPEQQSWLRRVRAAEDPLSVLDDLRAGTLTTEAVETLAATAPDLLADIKQTVQTQVQQRAEQGKPISIEQETELATLLEIETEYTAPEFIAAVQATKAQEPEPPQGRPSAGPIGIKQFPLEGERIES